MVDMATLNILRAELATVRRSRDKLAEAIAPKIVLEAAWASGKLTEAADDPQEIRAHGG
jgi:hypothetical protein